MNEIFAWHSGHSRVK